MFNSSNSMNNILFNLPVGEKHNEHLFHNGTVQSKIVSASKTNTYKVNVYLYGTQILFEAYFVATKLRRPYCTFYFHY